MTKLRTVHRRAQLLGGVADGNRIRFRSTNSEGYASLLSYLGRIGIKPAAQYAGSDYLSVSLDTTGGQTIDTQTVVSAPGAVEGNSC